jgi:hypothetical protein
MRFQSITLVLLAFASMVAVKPTSAACSLATLNGIYGYYHGRPGGGATLTAVVGQLTSDGKGNLSGVWTMSVNGTISNGSFDGTYTIAANCTGTMTFATEDTVNAHFNITLDDAHHGFQMIQTDNGFAQPGFGLAQGTVTCGLTGVKETFATNFLGFLFSTSQIEAISGQVKLNGLGSISGTETLSVAGTISTVPVTGTYNEGSDCRGGAQITPTGFPVTNFNFVVVNGSKELLLIETDSTTLVSGTAQQ